LQNTVRKTASLRGPTNQRSLTFTRLPGIIPVMSYRDS
jgi:hypothetical protein